MAIGKLWNFFGSRRGVISLIIQFVILLVSLHYYSGYHSSDKCVFCHADSIRMTKLGYPQFVMTREQVQKESRHPNTECRDCHLGNGLSDDPDRAHKGMLKVIVLDNDLNSIPRKGLVKQLLPSGDDRLRAMLPRDEKGGRSTRSGR